MKVVQLHPELDCYGISKALRNIADDIEAGAYVFDPTMAVVVLATETHRRDSDGVSASFDWQTHGLGKDTGIFMARGILASALGKMDSSG